MDEIMLSGKRSIEENEKYRGLAKSPHMSP
jgi:hypothetical protein